MKYPITITGRTYLADAAAISCIRYRSEYGVSPMAEFAQQLNQPEARAKLVKLIWIMVRPDEDYAEFATMCLQDEAFVDQALALRSKLLKADERYTPTGQSESVSPEQYDEFDALARMSHTGMPECLIYELTMPQLQATINRSLEYLNKARDTKPQMVKMSPQEVSQLLGGGTRG